MNYNRGQIKTRTKYELLEIKSKERILAERELNAFCKV